MQFEVGFAKTEDSGEGGGSLVILKLCSFLFFFSFTFTIGGRFKSDKGFPPPLFRFFKPFCFFFFSLSLFEEFKTSFLMLVGRRTPIPTTTWSWSLWYFPLGEEDDIDLELRLCAIASSVASDAGTRMLQLIESINNVPKLIREYEKLTEEFQAQGAFSKIYIQRQAS